MKKEFRISVTLGQIVFGVVCLLIPAIVGVVSYFVTQAMSHHSGSTLVPILWRIAVWFAIVLVILLLILIWAIYRRKKWRATMVVRLWRSIQTRVLRQTPRPDLIELRDRMYALRLALHGITPEQEVFRRTHFEMHNEPVPPLILPLQNRELYREFEAVKKCLELYGFPYVKKICMQPKMFAHFHQWAITLETRLLEQETQQQETQQALAATALLHRTIGQTYEAALIDPGYLRLHGAIKLLQRMAQENSVSSEVVQICTLRLQQDMEQLVQKLWQQQKAA